MRTCWLLAAVGAALLGGAARSGSGDSFDKLNDADRKVFQERFEKELWPLLARNGKDGCVGCHHPRVNNNMLRFSGKADQDFRFLLKEGFFLHDDPGNLLARVVSKDRKARMPPPGRTPWTAEEAQVLRRFIADLDKKQQK